MSAESNIGFVPAGAMNTALAVKLRDRGDYDLVLWMHGAKTYSHYLETGQNEHLVEADLSGMTVTASLQRACEDKGIIFFTPRSINFLSTLEKAAPFIDPEAVIITGTKGFVRYDGKYHTPSEVIEKIIPDVKNRVAVLSGPDFASEIVKGVITGTTVAAYNTGVAQQVKNIFNGREGNDFLVRVYKGNPREVEVCGVFKNVIGLVMGFARTLPNYGENTGALILQQGLKETAILCRAMKCNSRVIMELCGIGDAALLMNSMKSRNVKAGYNFGKGIWTIEDLKDEKRTIEGVGTTMAVKELAGEWLKRMPLTTYAYEILYQGMNPQAAVADLLSGKVPAM